MKTYALDELPAHVSLNMTPSERAGLPPLTIAYGRPMRGFVQASAPNEGRWTVSPGHKDGDQTDGYERMAEIKYHPPFGERSYADLMANAASDPDEEFRVQQMLVGFELGKVWSQTKALDLIEHSRRTFFEGSADEQLRAAGFKPEEAPGMYRRRHGLDWYSVLVHDTGNVWLMFEPHGETGWHNLLILNRATPLREEGRFFPIHWPNTVNDPLAAMAGLAVRMSHLWTPDLLPQRVGRGRPKAAP